MGGVHHLQTIWVKWEYYGLCRHKPFYLGFDWTVSRIKWFIMSTQTILSRARAQGLGQGLPGPGLGQPLAWALALDNMVYVDINNFI